MIQKIFRRLLLQPSKKRYFKLPYSVLCCTIAFYACNLMLHWCGFDIIWKLCAAMTVGLILHLGYKRQAILSCANGMYWFITYMIGLLILSYLGSFGGIGFLTFHFDCLVILTFSLLSLYLSQQCIEYQP